MLESSIPYIMIRTFPESIVLILSGVILLGISINVKKIFKQSMILGFIVVSIRILPINFGVHTLLSMIGLGLILFRLSSNNILNSIVSTCMIFISLVLSEGIYVFIATDILKIPIETLMNNQSFIGALITLPSLIITFIIVMLFSLVIKKIKKDK